MRHTKRAIIKHEPHENRYIALFSYVFEVPRAVSYT